MVLFVIIVKCGEGTYFDAEEEDCLSCAAGTYQDEEGKTSCKKCPERTWTIGHKAGNRTECIGNLWLESKSRTDCINT